MLRVKELLDAPCVREIDPQSFLNRFCVQDSNSPFVTESQVSPLCFVASCEF